MRCCRWSKLSRPLAHTTAPHPIRCRVAGVIRRPRPGRERRWSGRCRDVTTVSRRCRCTPPRAGTPAGRKAATAPKGGHAAARSGRLLRRKPRNRAPRAGLASTASREQLPGHSVPLPASRLSGRLLRRKPRNRAHRAGLASTASRDRLPGHLAPVPANRQVSSSRFRIARPSPGPRQSRRPIATRPNGPGPMSSRPGTGPVPHCMPSRPPAWCPGLAAAATQTPPPRAGRPTSPSPKEAEWKSCWVNTLAGSNPASSAGQNPWICWAVAAW
jgi:hypothetical protein